MVSVGYLEACAQLWVYMSVHACACILMCLCVPLALSPSFPALLHGGSSKVTVMD